MINPFRTKRIIIAYPKYKLLIKVPFIGKIQVIKTKYKTKIKGQTIKSIVLDEIK